jgi:hypothetical protein
MARRAANTTTEDLSIWETLGAIIEFDTFLKTCSNMSRKLGIAKSRAGFTFLGVFISSLTD